MASPETSRAAPAAILVGCTDLPHGLSRRRFFSAVGLLETHLPGDAVPSDRVLERWAAEAGERGSYALIAPRGLCAPGRAGANRDEIREGAVRLAAAAGRLRARAVVFVTPAELSPSATHRERLRRLFGEDAPAELFGEVVRVWQPGGLWHGPEAAAMAEELGVVAAHDPLATDVLDVGDPEPGDVACARVSGLGRPGRPLGEDDLMRVAEWIAPAERALVSFATPSRFDDARALEKLLALARG